MNKLAFVAFAITIIFTSFSLKDAKAQYDTRALDSELYDQRKSVAEKLYPEANVVKPPSTPREKLGIRPHRH